MIDLLAQTKVPLVLDADGLNALEGQTEYCTCPGPRVLTPHPGEFARLLGSDIATVQGHRAELATRFAAEHGVVLLLKGHETIVTDGRSMYRNRTGNPGMATGGTGDVLTGLIAALLAQGLARSPPRSSVPGGGMAVPATWWHDELGEACLIASDLLQYLPAAPIRSAGM